ncbi:ATP-binding protein [Streptomyces sp. NPDC005409]|uniref:sensor histidine kinase n=1 Tax=Streptomyces sp. NPDC005409 TaxID=3155342 RepID=UPI003453CEA2
MRAAVLPTLAAALSGAAAVLFTLQLGGGAGDRDARLWPVLTGCALLVAGALAAALLGAQRSAKAVRDRCEALRRSSVRGRQELRTAADRLERGEAAPRPVRGGPTGPAVGGDPAGVDEFWLLSQELRGAREQAHETLVRLAGPPAPSDSERKVEVFVNLARRLQSLVHREISLLDELEDTVEDPDLLKELFHVDHLATRIRRHAENLAVLGGAASRRQWTRPIDLSEVLRSSVAEVEQYTRVKVVPPAGGSVRGHAVADVVHLLAELVENATVFSAPDTDVVLRAERVTAGIAVEVEDRGLGMPAEEQHRMNALLRDPDQVSVRQLLADGRIGLYVVSALARRHGIAVELKSNIYGGVLAVLVLPQELLGAQAPSAADAAGGSRATSWGTGQAEAPPLEPVRVPAPAPVPDPGRPAGAPPRAGETAPAGARARASAPDTGPASAPARGQARGRASVPAWAPDMGLAREQAPGTASVPARGQAPDRASASAWAPDAGPAPASAREQAPNTASASAWAPAPAPVSASAREQAPARASASAWAPETGPASASPLTPALPSAPAAPDTAPAPVSASASAASAPGARSAATSWPAPEQREQLEPGAVVPPGLGAAPGSGRVPGGEAWTVPAPRAGEPAPTTAGPAAADPHVPAARTAGDRPTLPRRQAQQHLAPQLREAPAPPRAADLGEQPVHDPGLMAAFQRGFGLAQSEEQA